MEIKQFVKHFRILFIITAIIVGIYITMLIVIKPKDTEVLRGNNSTPGHRVFDTANVLSDSEERMLEKLIAECEDEGTCDIILVTINQKVGLSDTEWNTHMMNIADDFYDDGAYGYNKKYGDGALILDNWYEDENGSQKGTWLSTSGKMENIIGAYEENTVLDRIYDLIDKNPAQAYAAGIRKLAFWGESGSGQSRKIQIRWLYVLGGPFVVALFYMLSHISNPPGETTTTAMTYVTGGDPRLVNKRDDFLRKTETRTRISSSSSGSGGSRSHSGGGSHGHHRSSGGHSHGGGGRRR